MSKIKAKKAVTGQIKAGQTEAIKIAPKDLKRAKLKIGQRYQVGDSPFFIERTWVTRWECVCAMCGHPWRSRSKHKPKICPKCRTRRWE